MKLIKTLRRLETLFLTKRPSHDFYLKTLVSFCIIILMTVVIWAGGPYVTWNHFAPLAPAEKRIYIVLSLFLLWLLKFIIIDLDTANLSQYQDPQIQKKWQLLRNRFCGAQTFLKKTTITKHGRQVHLNQLPWYLLIGPHHAGKTTLLANSGVNFILQRHFQQRHFQHQQSQQLAPSEHCDWWLTQDASIIDVPGNYSVLWSHLLRLIKKYRGHNGMSGIVIALPLPEIMKHNDPKHFQALLDDLSHQMSTLQHVFPQPIPCHLIITKCDLIPGFLEFFAESGNDEITQAWGIRLSQIKKDEPISDLFTKHFNVLIKKLNQQLLWRLHQERNPMARPYIKDFPLQVERLKEMMLDFIKKISTSNVTVPLHSVFLTSALQNKPDDDPNTNESTVFEPAHSTQRAMQIFKAPLPVSRAYFIKQLITHGLTQGERHHPPSLTPSAWARRITYAASMSIIGIAAILLGKDFRQGVKQTYAVQHNLSNYRLIIQHIQNPDDQLMKALDLLDTLQASSNHASFKLDLNYFLSFYSRKSQQYASETYQQALQTILMPEIKNYLADYLRTPVNRNTEYVYAALKAYLMLGDAAHLQPEFIVNTMTEILPKSINISEANITEANITKANHLMDHIRFAFHSHWQPLSLDTHLIEQTRKFLTGMPSLRLSYLILKNIENNNIEIEMNLGTNTGEGNVFITPKITNQIPLMFTAKIFPAIVSQEITTAAEEATMGNWVLGNNADTDVSAELINALIEQLRSAYVNNYIDVWESLLANIQLTAVNNLTQTDAMISRLISDDSPLLQLLLTLHDNTYFEPITSSSTKLQSLGTLVDKNNQSGNLLYPIFASLQLMHQYLQPVLSADNEKKAAFEIVSNRMLHRGSPDAITQLRLVADKSPEPIKHWLNKITNLAWHFLMQDASQYIDTSWQDQVARMYQTHIASRYPFSTVTDKEVELNKFVAFFGNPGTLLNFYNKYLQPFVDTSAPDWHWSTVDNNKLPFSDETLQQIQQAIRIHHMFFPNGDNQLYVQFALQPYKFGTSIKQVKLTINNKQIVDGKSNVKSPHVMAWPSTSQQKMTAVQLTLTNQQVISRHYSGDWGWFKFVNQSFENAISPKEMLLNLSVNKHPARYLLFTAGQINPFMSANLQHFYLPLQLTDQK